MVATWHELKPLDAGKHAAAAIRLPGHAPIVVFSVHLKCCGFVGGEDDQKRMAETREIIVALDRSRRDFPNIGIVIAGDYNLVGSRTPVDLLEKAGFRQWILPHRFAVSGGEDGYPKGERQTTIPSQYENRPRGRQQRDV